MSVIQDISDYYNYFHEQSALWNSSETFETAPDERCPYHLIILIAYLSN